MCSFFSRLGLIVTMLLHLGCAAPTATQPAAREPDATMPPSSESPFRYVALGDSTVEGIGATSSATSYVGQIDSRLRERYGYVELTNLGVGGATSADVIRDQLPRAIELQPQLVTLSVGPNDITQGMSFETYAQNMAS
jgi:lysophospholipase L1-like esterase